MQEALLDLDADRHLGPLPLHLQPGQDLLVADDAGAAVDAQGVLAAGDQEDQPEVRVLHDVGEAIDAVVADPVRDREVGVVQDHHEAGRVALGGDVAAARRTRGGDQHEGGPGDERAGVRVEPAAILPHRALAGGAEERPQLLAGRHDVLEHGIFLLDTGIDASRA